MIELTLKGFDKLLNLANYESADGRIWIVLPSNDIRDDDGRLPLGFQLTPVTSPVRAVD